MPEEEMIEMPASRAILNAASFAFPFLLQPETFPVFYAWVRQQGRTGPGYTAEMMRHDLMAVTGALMEVRGA